MDDDYSSFDFGGGDDFDISSFLGGDSGINFESLDAGPGAVDLSGLEGIDLSNLLAENGGIDLAGLNLGPEAFDIASLLGGDTEALSRGINSKRVNLDEYERSLLGPGDFDQAAPPANIAEILTSAIWTSRPTCLTCLTWLQSTTLCHPLIWVSITLVL